MSEMTTNVSVEVPAEDAAAARAAIKAMRMTSFFMVFQPLPLG
jgi:hypothetical protein